MAIQIQFRRGTTSTISSTSGSQGEVFVDTDKDTAVVMDGATNGGFGTLRADLNNCSSILGTNQLQNGSVTADKLDLSDLGYDFDEYQSGFEVTSTSSWTTVHTSVVNKNVSGSKVLLIFYLRAEMRNTMSMDCRIQRNGTTIKSWDKICYAAGVGDQPSHPPISAVYIDESNTGTGNQTYTCQVKKNSGSNVSFTFNETPSFGSNPRSKLPALAIEVLG